MSLTSWLSDTELFDDLDLNEGKHQPHPEPLHSRPTLESLEERTLLNANNGFIEGSFHNLNLNNNFNFGSNGIVLPMQNLSGPTTNGSMGSNGIHAVDPSGRVSSGTVAEATSSAFLAQDQPYAQFRVFGVNAQGDDPHLSQQTTAFILRDAYGFGSGTQPNAPWMPNAYNLGLANHQFNYSTQGDNGFAPVAPWGNQWSSRVAQSRQNNQNTLPDEDKLQPLQKDEQGTEKPEQAAAQRTLSDPDEPPQQRLDKDTGVKTDDLQALIEQQTAEKKSPIERAAKEDGTLPDTLWLSALAPAPMAALVAGLPGMPVAAAGGGGVESGEAVDAPE